MKTLLTLLVSDNGREIFVYAPDNELLAITAVDAVDLDATIMRLVRGEIDYQAEGE